MIKVFICDDHLLFREGVANLLRMYTDITIVGEADTGFDLKSRLANAACDVIILDLSMPGGGVDLIKEMSDQYPQTAVLVLSMHAEDHFAVRCFKAGAKGYLSKNCLSESLVEAIRTCAKGECFLTKKSAHLFVSALHQKNKKIDGHESLSDREFEVMIGIAEGRSLTEIGESLCLSVKTVSTYRTRILAKLNMHSNAEIVHYVLSQGLTKKFSDDDGPVADS